MARKPLGNLIIYHFKIYLSYYLIHILRDEYLFHREKIKNIKIVFLVTITVSQSSTQFFQVYSPKMIGFWGMTASFLLKTILKDSTSQLLELISQLSTTTVCL